MLTDESVPESHIANPPGGRPMRDALRTLGFAFDPQFSCEPERSQNYIIHGENLAILRALRSQMSGTVRCVYLDPPYNNQEVYNHYTDELSHEVWREQVCDRLAVVFNLLTPDGSVWISIDDGEMHYLKVEADRIFGRSNFVATIVWQHRTTRENRRVFSNNHEYLLVYAKDSRLFKQTRAFLPASEALAQRYKNPDDDPRGPWQSVSANAQAGHGTPNQFYLLIAPNGRVHYPPPGRCWVYSEQRMREEIAAGNVWFGRDGDAVPRVKKFLNGASLGLTPETLWTADAVGTTDQAKKQILSLFPDDEVFDTPKPERLLERILQIATREDDCVLDPYLGSGTTAAVAGRMGRRFIGIERGPQAFSLCAKRTTREAQCSGFGFAFYRAPESWR